MYTLSVWIIRKGSYCNNRRKRIVLHLRQCTKMLHLLTFYALSHLDSLISHVRSNHCLLRVAICETDTVLSFRVCFALNSRFFVLNTWGGFNIYWNVFINLFHLHHPRSSSFYFSNKTEVEVKTVLQSEIRNKGLLEEVKEWLTVRNISGTGGWQV